MQQLFINEPLVAPFRAMTWGVLLGMTLELVLCAVDLLCRRIQLWGLGPLAMTRHGRHVAYDLANQEASDAGSDPQRIV